MATTDIIKSHEETMAEQAIDRAASFWPATVTGGSRFKAVAMSLALKDATLRDCTIHSKLLALVECARLGMVPDRHTGHIWLVPFRDKGVKKVTVIPGYRGYIHLWRRSGIVRDARTAVVHANDRFEFDLGTEQALTHKPWWHVGAEEPGPVVAAYCIAEFTDGSCHVEVMHVSELESVRARVAARNKGRQSPWDTDVEEMYRKTVVRRAAKYLPIDPNVGSLIALDERAEQGEDPAIPDDGSLDGLLPREEPMIDMGKPVPDEPDDAAPDGLPY